jgi:hypothetical protein
MTDELITRTYTIRIRATKSMTKSIVRWVSILAKALRDEGSVAFMDIKRNITETEIAVLAAEAKEAVENDNKIVVDHGAPSDHSAQPKTVTLENIDEFADKLEESESIPPGATFAQMQVQVPDLKKEGE